MPITCVVYGCGNSTRNGNFSWHRFPDAAKHPHLLEMWVSSIKQNSRTMIEFAPNKWSRICSEHFSDHMKETVGNRVVLKLNAVPTIFKNAVNIDYSDEGAKGLLDAASYIETQLNIPVNEVCIGKSIVSEEVEFEKSLVPMPDLVMDDNQINLTQNDCTIEEHDSQVINFNCLLHDHTYSCQSPYRLKRQLEEVIEKAESLKKKLKNSRMQNGRLRMKVNDMSSVVSSLTEEGFVNVDQAEILNNTLSGVSRDIFNRLTHEDKTRVSYPPELRWGLVVVHPKIEETNFMADVRSVVFLVTT
ncbi:THAP domain-containing protein 1 B-like isoform X3 [Xenia sp. Carnegie-2017]|uniref:THAP domain-containing protein 1 B-like isoform X3 n=1 Tax=Xenia sp. Carnegie-2017 TaxID=2897299 RepID=UPI001F041477|nr:THAP domain-containing protein 1 B-like isoform X3 [Xenia sp. Carnegie-2017]